MKENKQQQQSSKASRKKLFHPLDQSTPSKSSSPINASTPSDFSPALSATSETSPSSIITESEKDETVDITVGPFGSSGLKIDSIAEELLTSHGYELRETEDLDVDLVEAEIVVDCLKVARHVLQAKDFDLASKKLLNRLIEVSISGEFCGLREEMGCSSRILSVKLSTMILLFLLLIVVASCAVFFCTQSSFNGPLPT